LEQALAAEGPRVPEHLRYLLSAAVRSGRFAQVVEEMVTVERIRLEVRHRMGLLLAYPFFLLVVALFIYLLSVIIVPQFGSIYRDFGAQLPILTQVMLHVCSPLAAVLLLALIGACAAAILFAMEGRSRVAWMQRMLYRLPIVGPIWRFRGLAEFSRLMSLLLDFQVPLPQALRAVSAGMREGDLRAAARNLATMVEAGVPLSEAMARLRAFPATFKPMVQWGEQASGGEKTPPLSDAFQGTAEMCEGRLRFQSFFANAVLLPMTLVAVLFFVGLLVASLMLPLISLITKLS